MTYREHPAKNYSTLYQLSVNPSKLKFKKESLALSKGSALDLLLLTPDKFDEEFAVLNERPTNQLLELAEECNNRHCEWENEIEEVANQKINEKFKYFGSTKKLEIRKKNWDTNLFYDYLNFLKKSNNKTILSSEEYQEIKEGVEILKNHDFTKDIFVGGVPQKDLYTKIENHEFKCLLDYFVNNNPFDLKSTSKSVFSFESSVYKYRLDIQSSLYSHIVRELYENVGDFKMVVYSFAERKPLVYNMSNFIQLGKQGFTRNDRYYKGWLQLANELDWHNSNNLFDYPKEVYLNNGEIKL